jgi:hypothetical protein
VRYLRYILCFLVYSLYFTVNGQIVLWTEDFETYGDNVSTAVDNNTTAVGVDWTVAAATGYYHVEQGDITPIGGVSSLTMNNGGSALDWESEAIDVSGYATTDISIDYAEQGTLENADVVKFQYQTNGSGPWTTFATIKNDIAPGTASVTGIAGATTIKVRINAKNNDATEYWIFDNIVVTGVSPLPVELLYFNTSQSDDGVRLTWATASELNNDYFQVEYSSDGLIYEPIEYIQGAGDSNQIINYQINVPHGNGYYRLKQVDFDGSYEYSNIKYYGLSKVAEKTIIDRYNIFGNPVREDYVGVIFIIYSDGSCDKIIKK